MQIIVMCVCTYKREKLLKACLDSVASMKLPDSVILRLLVVDNDSLETSRVFVEDLAARFPIELSYVCEPRRGIPCARNRAIDEAHKYSADFLVFIDDDEQVRPDWLEVLYDYCLKMGGESVIHGGVEFLLPEGTPQHIQAEYQRKKRQTGDKLHSCATNNVIIPIRVTRELGLRFDESSPLAGGTDTIFFAEAVKKGVEIYECSEAMVAELVPPNRTTLRWLAKRKYRAGITDAWRKHQNGRHKFSIMLSAALQILVEILKCIIAICIGSKVYRNKSWLKICRCCGVVMGLFGAQVDSYREIDS